MTFARTDTTFTIFFNTGTFRAGESFAFGMSVFSPLEGTTQLDPDRLEGTRVTVTLEDNTQRTGTFLVAPKTAVNVFTGSGLVNAAAAVR